MGTFRKWDHLKPNEDVSCFFTDFFRLDADDWVITTTEAGAGSATEAIADAPHGILVLTNDAADDDVDQIQSAAEGFQFIAGKKLSFKTRFKVNDATQSDLLIGLAIRDTSLIASAPSDGIYFRKNDGDKLLDFVVAKNGTASELLGVAGTATELADDTFVTVEFYYNGGPVGASTGVEAGRIEAYVNNIRVGSLPLTNAPDDEALAVSFAIMNGEAVAKVLSIDYVLARQQR